MSKKRTRITTKAPPSFPTITPDGVKAMRESPEDLAFEAAMEREISHARKARPKDAAALDYAAGEPWEPLRRAGMQPKQIVEALVTAYKQRERTVKEAGKAVQRILRGA